MRQLELLLAEALNLPEDQRAQLALRLAESLEPAPASSAQEAWAREITRRVERLRAGTARTVTAEDAIANARAKLAAHRG